jgi:hypothetical protein
LFVSLEEASAWLDTKGSYDSHAKLAFHLAMWNAKDLHLTDYARGVENHLQLHRREIYRRAAHRLSLQYQTVVVEKWDKSETALMPEVEDLRVPSHQEVKASANRQFVGVSVFTQALKQAFGAGLYFEEDAKDITTTHFQCGGKADDVKRSLMTECQRCEQRFDQDLNAARHLWDRYRERSGGAPEAAPSRNEEIAAE